MLADDFVFDLPEELIAARPVERRDASRLMVLGAGAETSIEHRHFSDLPEYLRAGDVLVLNNSRVIPARLFAHRATGGSVELLLLHPEGAAETWRGLVRPARKIHAGERLAVAEGLEAEIIAEHEVGERTIRFHCAGDFRAALDRVGQMPLPPYILKRRAEEAGDGPHRDELHEAADRERYQTVYAQPEGSVAAPTAGLHFTEELLGRMRGMGVELVFVTLHVGAGTFQLMQEGGHVEDHRMHFEDYEVPVETAERVNAARREGRRIVAVGTTSARTLEAAFDKAAGLRAGSGRTNLMITPGHDWRVVDVLVTNFHLPRSTLLLLVSAFSGRERILHGYAEAVRQKYRFFSYGDAMLLFR